MEAKPRIWRFDGDDNSYLYFLERIILEVYERNPSVLPTQLERSVPITPKTTSDATCAGSSTSNLPNTNVDSLVFEIWNPPSLLSHTSKQACHSKALKRCSNKWDSVAKRIPKNQEDWKLARRTYGLESVQSIESYLTDIQKLSWIRAVNIIAGCSITDLGNCATTLDQESKRLQGISNVVSFLFASACLVDKEITGDSQISDQALKSYFRAMGHSLRQDGDKRLKRFKTGVTGIIRMIDRIYLRIGDPAFEILVYMSLSPIIIERVSQNDIDYTVALFSNEKQNEAPRRTSSSFYIVHLLNLWRPDLSLEIISKALKSHLSDKINPTVNTVGDLDLRRPYNWIQGQTSGRCLPFQGVVLSVEAQPEVFTEQSISRSLVTVSKNYPDILSDQRLQTPLNELSATHQDHDYIVLAKFLTAVGGTVDNVFFRRLQGERATCNAEGELVHTGSFNDFPLIANNWRMTNAIKFLRHQKLLRDDGQLFSLDPGYQQTMEREIMQSVLWKLIAIKAVVYSFPEHRHFEPLNYLSISKALLPNLKIALRYLQEAEVIAQLDCSDIDKVTGVCLSGSYFLDISWKKTILTVASNFLVSRGKCLSRIQIRQLALARLSHDQPAHELCNKVQSLIRFHERVDQRSNGLFGEMILLHARLLVDMDRNNEALNVLESCQPYNPGNISWVERVQLGDIEFLKAQVSRFQGNFVKSLFIFKQLLERSPTPHKITHQIAALQCELGLFNEALFILEDDLSNLHTLRFFTGSRLLLALLEMYVTKATWVAAQRRQDLKATRTSAEVISLLGKVKSLINELDTRFKEQSMLTKIDELDRFRLRIASAITKHLIGDPVEAVAHWDRVQEASSKNWTVSQRKDMN
ncbi:folylpolyglutamate synthase [Fusarium beomiforme]|uniref:Folylpolyglutamate synthase n=1 Tax=Fusarium beomiforme TaxID=44412 RepID=A0A9P5AGB7_9HYPO|nr:folylpolyglutamate synthase [Fusarium beomiforme]